MLLFEVYKSYQLICRGVRSEDYSAAHVSGASTSGPRYGCGDLLWLISSPGEYHLLVSMEWICYLEDYPSRKGADTTPNFDLSEADGRAMWNLEGDWNHDTVMAANQNLRNTRCWTYVFWDDLLGQVCPS